MNPTDLPTDLPHEVAERTPQPGFDAVIERAGAGRRRRRTAIAPGRAAAVVVAGVAAVAGGVVGDRRSPEPASPAPDDRLPSDVMEVLADDQLQLWSISGGADGAHLALWRGCDVDPCRFAVVIRNGDDVHGELLGASVPTVTPVPGGWLVEDARGITRLSPSGDRSEIVDTGPGSDVMPGDTAVRTTDGWRLLRGDKLISLHELDLMNVADAYVTEAGRLLVASGGTLGPVTVSGTDDGRSWDHDVAPRVTDAVTAVLTGSGDHVAVVLLGEDQDGSIPVVDVLLTEDAGRRWSMAVNLDTSGGDRVRNMSAFAVGADGTTYLTTESHHLVRVDDDGFATPIQLSASETGVFTSGDEVCVVVERGRYDALVCSTDGLTGWADQPLPGLG